MTRVLRLHVISPFAMFLKRARQVSADGLGDLAPFLSVLIVIGFLFTVVFCKMEVRRIGYSVLTLSRAERRLQDHERERMIQLAKMTRPERLEAVAREHLTFKKPESGQIIQMTGQGIALKQ